MEKIAESTQAKFEYWIQSKWEVLPTDPRYKDLTDEQLDLLLAHYIRENPPPQPENDGRARDDDYDDEEQSLGEHREKTKETVNEYGDEADYLPKTDHESFSDPDFDEIWNSDDLEEKPISSYSEDEWEEV